MNRPSSTPHADASSPAALLRKIVAETSELYHIAGTHRPVITPDETLRFFNNGSLSVSGNHGALQIYEGTNGRLEVAASIGAKRASWILESYDDELAEGHVKLLEDLSSVVTHWRNAIQGAIGQQTNSLDS